MKKDKEYNDLKLSDLGYFKIEYLKEIDKSGSSFISKIKSNTSLYMKNPNPKKTKSGYIIKCREYIKIDVIELANPLAEGETIELNDIYIGSKKELKSRLIALLLSSSIVFTAKNTIWEEDNKEISEIKYFGALAQYLPKLAHEIFKGKVCIIRILQRIILSFKRLGIKSRKKHRKTVFDILEIIELKADEIEKIAI